MSIYFETYIEGEKICKEENTMRNKVIAQMLVEDIDRCKAFLENPSDENYGRSVYDEITGRYDSIISDFGKGLYQYFDEQHFYDPYISIETLKYNLKKLMNKMETYVTLNILQIICWMKIRLPDEFVSRTYNRSMTYFKGTTRFR